MADTLKQYCSKYIGATSTLMATAGASGAVVRNIHICNVTSSAQSFSLSIGVSSAYSDTKALYKTFSVPALGIHVANVNVVLAPGEQLYAVAASGSSLVATISGVDV